jgi:hypothetical protein
MTADPLQNKGFFFVLVLLVLAGIRLQP